MKDLRRIAVFLCVLSALPMGATAQTVYRCGDSYSQSPCPGGQAVQAADERSKAQKAQADAAIQRDSHTADAMEKSRLKQEALQARSNSAPAQTTPHATPGAAESGKKTANGKKSRKPEYFTAREAGEKKKKSSSNHPQASSETKPATTP